MSTQEDVEADEPLTKEEFRNMMNDIFEPSSEEVEQAKDEEAEGRGGDGENVAVRGESARVTEDRHKSEEMKAHHTLRAILEHTNRDRQSAGEHIRKLYDAGAYSDRKLEDDFQNARGAGDFYSTVVDADGGILLPTEVRDEIQELADQVGVAREIANTFQQVRGSIKVPGATGVEDSADAVAEGGEITSSKRAFQSVTLNPQKWAQIVPWSYEAQIELAPQILEDVQRALARSFARAEDEALIEGDGTSSYNGINGVFNQAGTTYTISGTGNVTGITPDDLVLSRNDLDPGARDKENLYYVFHPDLENIFLTRTDNNNQYVFDYVEREGVTTLKGIPVLYSEILFSGDTNNTKFGALINGRYVDMALGEGMTSEEMTTGTVKDADTGSDINLGTRDLRALKARMFFDLDINFGNAMVAYETGS